MTNCIFPKENIFFRKSCLFFLKQIDKSWYGTVVGQKNHQKCPEGPGLKEVKVRWKKEKGRSFFWSVLPLTAKEFSSIEFFKKIYISWLLVCEIPLHSISLANFSCQPCHSYKKLCYKKTFNIVFITTVILSKTFKIEIKTLGLVFEMEKFGKQGRLHPNLICSKKVTQFLCWRRQIF